MGFRQILDQWPPERLEALYSRVNDEDVKAAVEREERDLRDLAVLLSPKARPYLEAMAQEAQRLTRRHFGRTISLYAPIYISNLCAADCVYCGFAAKSGNREKRITLRPDGIRRECEALARHGFKSVLLLTGEAPRVVTPDYIAHAVALAREYFPSVAVEVYSLDEEHYSDMVSSGLDGVTLYMETYDRETYKDVHLLGEKSSFDYRLGALERAGTAGVRRLSLGVLLGLFRWQLDVLWMALHARYLQKHCWQSAVNVSFPRLLHTPARYHVADIVSDTDLVQILLALRLFLPDAGFNLSTRERPELRDRLLQLGITHMSAGSSTRPGGYAAGSTDERGREILEQFAIEDYRSPREVALAIRRAGYDPVWKDFDHAFDAPAKALTGQQAS